MADFASWVLAFAALAAVIAFAVAALGVVLAQKRALRTSKRRLARLYRLHAALERAQRGEEPYAGRAGTGLCPNPRCGRGLAHGGDCDEGDR